MAIALHVAADYGAVEHVERRDSVVVPWLIVVRHGPGAVLLQRQTGLGAVERLNLAFFVHIWGMPFRSLSDYESSSAANAAMQYLTKTREYVNVRNCCDDRREACCGFHSGGAEAG
jgi:hypothetical protein